MFKITDSETFYFCDNVHDLKDNKLVYHVEAISTQKTFEPSGAIELQVKMCGKRTLFKTTASLIEQIDGFYPAAPNSIDAFYEMSGRTWSKQNVLTNPVEIVFETKTTTPTVCYKHGEGNENRFSKEFFSVIKIPNVPASVSCLPETYYLRFTYFVKINGFSNSSWGGTRNFNIKIPISFSNVLNIKDKVPVTFFPKQSKGTGQPRKPQTFSPKLGALDPTSPRNQKDMRKAKQDFNKTKMTMGMGGMLDAQNTMKPSHLGPKSTATPRSSNESQTSFGYSHSHGHSHSGDIGSEGGFDADDESAIGEMFSRDFCDTLFRINKYNSSGNNKQMNRSKANSLRKNVVPLGFGKLLDRGDESDATVAAGSGNYNYAQSEKTSSLAAADAAHDILITNPALIPDIEYVQTLLQDPKTGSTKRFKC